MRQRQAEERARLEEAKEAKLLGKYRATQQKLENVVAQMKCPLTAVGVKWAFKNLNACRPLYQEAQKNMAAAVDAFALLKSRV